MDFSGKRILITGGSAGIGLALAEALAARGARLALLARNPETLQAAAQQVSRHGAPPLTLSADICDVAALAEGISTAATTLGGLDGLIVNAGYCHPGEFLNTALDDLHRQVNTNLLGAINTLHIALPHLQRGGFVAITSSPAGALPIYGFAAYNATKAALIALGNTLRLELATKNISVHLLLPPDTDTPGYANETTLYPPETRAILAGGALLSPEKVAQAFVKGIARGQRTIVAGNDARLALFMQRFAPWVWDRYVAGRIRNVRKS
jgi:3-dehydrosphinganine reductase